MLWKKILVAVDFSPCSRDALRVAARLAAESSAALAVAYAWTPPVVFAGETIGLPAGLLTDLIATAQRELATWKFEAEGYGAKNVTAEFLTGAAWHEVVSLAKHDHDIGLIVTGTHGRTGIKHAFLGSIAEKIVRHAPCAVMVVPSM
ncbi:MAG: universal stress protein [Casimicrobiaceae bacterium]